MINIGCVTNQQVPTRLGLPCLPPMRLSNLLERGRIENVLTFDDDADDLFGPENGFKVFILSIFGQIFDDEIVDRCFERQLRNESGEDKRQEEEGDQSDRAVLKDGLQMVNRAQGLNELVQANPIHVAPMRTPVYP